MKLRSIAVNQFKKYTAPIRLGDIGDGLNVLIGPNEMGKSTLLDALRAALFEKYSSKAQPILALQNDRNKAAPVVELTFEVDDGVYRIQKRFVKKPYAQLFCPDGRKLEGDEAEDTLRDLLGFDEPGKSGAKPEHLGMWNVLWVRQGESFGALNLPDSARSNLHSALESEVGEVLGGKRGRALPDAVQQQLADFVTSTGRPRGSFKELIDEAERLGSELEGLRNRRSELSSTLESLETAEDTLSRLSKGNRDEADKADLETARSRHTDLSKLESRIEAGTSEVELRSRTVEQAEQAVADRRKLKDRIGRDEQDLEAAKNKLDEVRRTEQELRKQVDELRKSVKETESAVTNSDDTVSHARRVLAAVQRNSHIRELEVRYKKALEAEAKQRSALKGAAEILVSKDAIQKIRVADRELETARLRLSAAATLISFDMPSNKLSRIQVDGEALDPDQSSIEAVEGTTIAIPDYGNISVQPAIKDRDNLVRYHRESNDALGAILESFGVETVDAAETNFAKRERLLSDAELARQEAELHAPESDSRAAGAEALADHIAGLKVILEKELSDLGLVDLPEQKDAEASFVSAQDSARDVREGLITARAALTGPEDELGRIQREFGGVKTRFEDGEGRLQALKQSLAEAEERFSDDALEGALGAAKEALADPEKVIAELEEQRDGETLAQLDARIVRLEKAIQDRRDKRTDLKEKIVRLQSHIEAIEGAGLDEAIQQKEREVGKIDDQLKRHKREVDVLTLLLSTLRSAESEAKERYLSPVLNRVRPYLQLLFPGAEITIDEDLRVVGVVRQDGYEEAFQHLSMGTQEQIAVLVRLAFAEMLVEQGHPATVVLDDALVFSDDIRMERMFDILHVVAQQVQVLVFTCREELFEGIGGQQLSLTPIDSEELASA